MSAAYTCVYMCFETEFISAGKYQHARHSQLKELKKTRKRWKEKKPNKFNVKRVTAWQTIHIEPYSVLQFGGIKKNCETKLCLADLFRKRWKETYLLLLTVNRFVK